MALQQGLQQRQTQNMAMTAQLQQSLKMLQMSSTDLSDIISNELDNNPLLAVDNGESSEVISSSTDKSNNDLTELGGNRDNFDNESLDYKNNWDDIGKGGDHKFENNSEYDLEDVISDEKDLRTHLIEQFYIDVADEQERHIGLILMDHLDDAGYFNGDLEDISINLGCVQSEVEKVLGKLQQLEPSGIFARTLAECLQIQLEEKNRLDPIMFIMLQNLELLGMRKFDILQDLCGVDEEELEEMILEIRALNPKPALGFVRKELTPGQPDLFVRKNDSGEYVVELNNAALPKLLVNKKYYQEISGSLKNKDDKKYVKGNLNSANFLIKALDQRANTMLKTAAAIVKFQQEFFEYGIKYLKPLTLAQIAEEIGMHESTISRVTSNKFMITPRGAFEMKYFFKSGVSNSGGEVASTSVKEVIKDIIKNEDREKPLSDDGITAVLKQKGMNISRRTVMKYREAMGIPSSYERKGSDFYNVA